MMHPEKWQHMEGADSGNEQAGTGECASKDPIFGKTQNPSHSRIRTSSRYAEQCLFLSIMISADLATLLNQVKLVLDSCNYTRTA